MWLCVCLARVSGVFRVLLKENETVLKCKNSGFRTKLLVYYFMEIRGGTGQRSSAPAGTAVAPDAGV